MPQQDQEDDEEYAWMPQQDREDDEENGIGSYIIVHQPQAGFSPASTSSVPSAASVPSVARLPLSEEPHRTQRPAFGPPGETVHFQPTEAELAAAPTARARQAILTWYERLNELMAYRNENGDCHVPQKFEDNRKLGIWVDKQRMEKVFLDDGDHKTSMTPERKALLESIGFQWAKRHSEYSDAVEDAPSIRTDDALFRHPNADEEDDPESGILFWEQHADSPHHDDPLLRRNFYKFSLLFSLNHAAGLAGLALAAAALGDTSDYTHPTGTLYLTYTLTALWVAVPVTTRWGSKTATVVGSALFGAYAACFWVGTTTTTTSNIPVLLGAALGGVGAGIAWTAQGTYFTETVERLTIHRRPVSEGDNGDEMACPTTAASTSASISQELAAVFAGTILISETVLDVLATVLVHYVPWSTVFAVYSAIAVASTVALQRCVVDYNTTTATAPVVPTTTSANNEHDHHIYNETTTRAASVVGLRRDATTALRLLITESKLKYFLPFLATFALAGAFLNSFVSGEVVPAVTGSNGWVGLLVAVHGVVAAGCALGLGRMHHHKEWILVVGCAGFAAVALPFVLWPDYNNSNGNDAAWSWPLLVWIYVAEGVGRATFEGTLKAIFADYFAYSKEAAFANIILQYGLASSAVYFWSTRFTCSSASATNSNSSSDPYCVEYRDGSFHNVLTFAVLVIGTSVVAVAGIWRASYLHHHVTDPHHHQPVHHHHRPSLTPLQKRGGSNGWMARRTLYQSVEVEMTETDVNATTSNLPPVT